MDQVVHVIYTMSIKSVSGGVRNLVYPSILAHSRRVYHST